MIYRTINTVVILFFILFILYSCNAYYKQENNFDYKKNIVGTWQAIDSESPNFKMTKSTYISLDKFSTMLFGKKSKYYIIKDTLYVVINNEQTSKSKIVLLTKDSLKTLNSGVLETYRKIRNW